MEKDFSSEPIVLEFPEVYCDYCEEKAFYDFKGGTCINCGLYNYGVDDA